MEKKKVSIWYLVLALLIVLIIIGAKKSLDNHHGKEYLVVHSRILESAKKCYLDEKCEGEITLKDLYDKGYLEVQVDPATKENMNEKLCIKYEKERAVFCTK